MKKEIEALKYGIMKSPRARIVKNALHDHRQLVKADIHRIERRLGTDDESSTDRGTLKRLHYDLELTNLMLIELMQDGFLQTEKDK